MKKPIALVAMVALLLLVVAQAQAYVVLWGYGTDATDGGKYGGSSHDYSTGGDAEGDLGDAGGAHPHVGLNGRTTTLGEAPLGAVAETYHIVGRVVEPVYTPWGTDDTDQFNVTILPGAVYDIEVDISPLYWDGSPNNTYHNPGDPNLWQHPATRASQWHMVAWYYVANEYDRRNNDPDIIWVEGGSVNNAHWSGFVQGTNYADGGDDDFHASGLTDTELCFSFFAQWYGQYRVTITITDPVGGGGEEVIPEPAGLGVVGLALLSLRRRRS